MCATDEGLITMKYNGCIKSCHLCGDVCLEAGTTVAVSDLVAETTHEGKQSEVDKGIAEVKKVVENNPPWDCGDSDELEQAREHKRKAKKKEIRNMERQWHPDKAIQAGRSQIEINVATQVFQYLGEHKESYLRDPGCL